MHHPWFERSRRLCARLTMVVAALALAQPWAAAQVSENGSSDDQSTASAGIILVRLRGGASGSDAVRGLFAIGPDSNHFRQAGAAGLTDGRLSPGGRYLAAGPPANSARDMEGVWIYDLTGSNSPRRVFDQKWRHCSWLNDGKQLLIDVQRDDGQNAVYRIDADGSNKTKLPMAFRGIVKCGSPDGRWLASLEIERGEGHQQSRIIRFRDDGTDSQKIAEELGGTILDWRFSPDGRKVAYSATTGEIDALAKTNVWIVDLNREQKTKVDYPVAGGTIVCPVWSPDGTRLALGLSSVTHEDGADRIVLVDLDGKNPRTIKLPLLATGKAVILDWK